MIRLIEKMPTEVCGEDACKDGDNHRDQVGREAARANQHLKFIFSYKWIILAFETLLFQFSSSKSDRKNFGGTLRQKV